MSDNRNLELENQRLRAALNDIINLSVGFPDGAPDDEFDNGYIAGALAAVAIAKAALAEITSPTA
jgi:hypothetical protein